MPSKNANERQIAATAMKLLSQYWTANEPVQIRELIGHEWLEDLSEFPSALVEEACQDYRRSSRRGQKPLSGDIRQRCIEIQNERAQRFQITSARSHAWPRWLEETWGPWPDGPRKRAKALAEAKAQQAAIDNRLSKTVDGRKPFIFIDVAE